MKFNCRNGKIYIITNKTNGDIYIGSTVKTLDERFKKHKSNINNKLRQWLYNAMKDNGKENYTIESIENYPCDNKKELFARESFYLKTLRPCLNMRLG